MARTVRILAASIVCIFIIAVPSIHAMWTDGGIPVCIYAGSQSNPAIISDGTGGAIITWKDSRSGNDIYAQRIDGSGAVLWASDGIPVRSHAEGQRDPVIVSDSAGEFVQTRKMVLLW